MLVIAALQENQGQPIKASHIVTDVYIKKAIKEEVMSDPVNQLLQIKFDWPVRLAKGTVQGTEQLLVRLGIATSASSTGPMLVVTDDLHPMGTCQGTWWWSWRDSLPPYEPVRSGY